MKPRKPRGFFDLYLLPHIFFIKMRSKLRNIGEKAKPPARLLLVALVALLFLSAAWASIFSDIPEDKKIWFELSFILLLAISAELLVVYLKQPTVMILLLIGIVISPSAVKSISPYISWAILSAAGLLGLEPSVAETIPHLIPTEGMVEVFAQLGAIFLLFKVGLHSEIQKIFNGKNFFVAFMGIILPFLGGYLYADMTGHGFGYAMFLGAALTATSVGVTVAVLSEFNVLDKEFSKIILGAAVIDDILGLLVLSLVKNFPTSFDLQTMTPFLSVIATAALFVVGGIKVGQYIVKRYFNTPIDACPIPNQVFLGVLVYLFAYSYVAEFIGLSAIVGAFIAGVTLNYSRIINKITEAVYPLEAFFTPIFFISLGMFVDINALVTSFWPIIIVTIIAILTKVIACGLAAKVIKASTLDSLIIGIGMVPRGEVALIIGLVGLNSGILLQSEYSIIASMAFLTTVIIPVILQKALAMKKQG